jgi:hypothetical protein
MLDGCAKVFLSILERGPRRPPLASPTGAPWRAFPAAPLPYRPIGADAWAGAAGVGFGQPLLFDRRVRDRLQLATS